MTELACCRRQLSGAIDSLGLTVEIPSRLSIEADNAPLAVLEDLLGKLEETAATFHAATAMLRSSVPADRVGRSGSRLIPSLQPENP
jgi:hypothetical protein